MNQSSTRPDCEALLSQAGWVRALAGHLTADAHAADDLSQDALAAALVRPPPGDRPLRGWLAGIVRNLARRERRDAGNRSARERAVARGEADSSSAELLERLESHRAVVEAVARLDEPYRTAILLRYFERLSPAAIAARTETPLRTVHTRLHRALTQLRAELDRAHGGDRRAWLLALIPFARGSQEWSAWGVGALVMDAKLKIAVAVVALVGVCSTIALWPSDDARVDPEAVAVVPSAPEVEPPDPPESARALEDAPRSVERRAQDVTEPTAAIAPPPALPAKLLGRAIDVERAPVPGVRVRYFDPEHGPKDGLEAETKADGSFELEQPLGLGHIDVVSPGWSSVLRPELTSSHALPKGREFVLVLARSVALGGTVVDEDGRPVPDAEVGLPVPFGLRSRFDTILDGSSAVERSTTAGPDGRFEIEAAAFPDAMLSTKHVAYLEDVRELPPRDDLAVEIVLRAANQGPERLIGVVVDLEGNPVEGAWVGMGSGSTKSGPSGRFALVLDLAGQDPTLFGGSGTEPLRAVKQGHLPAEMARPAAEAPWPDPLILRLGGPPPGIAGRVVDAEGTPVPKAQVWIEEETHFGLIEIEGGEMMMTAGTSIEGMLRGDPWSRRVTADSEGRFELAGLLPRDYQVRALERKRLLATLVSLSAGARNVEIRLPEEDLYDRVSGRVTSLSGEPAEGVQVALVRREAAAETPEFDWMQTTAVKTDAEGRFEFEKVSRAANSVKVSGSDLDMMGFRYSIRPEDDVEDLSIAVPFRVHVQVDAGESTEFDRIAVLDEKDEKLYLSVDHGKSSYAMEEIGLEAGRSEPFSVSEVGKTLVLYLDKTEVRRMALKLVRGELNTIRP